MKKLEDWTPQIKSCENKQEKTSNNTSVNYIDRILIKMTTLGSVLFYGCGFAYADDKTNGNANKMFTDLNDTLFSIAKSISTTGLAVCALCGAIAFILSMLYPSEQGASTGKRWLSRIFFCIAGLCCLGLIISFIVNITDGYGISDYQGQILK